MCARALTWTALAAAIGALLLLSGCSPSASSAPKPRPEASVDPGPAPQRKADLPARPSGPSIEVTWEALAREKYLMETSRFKRRGAQPPQKITLLSESHPDAERARVPRTRADREKYVNTAVLPDRDLLSLIDGLRRRGFYRHARPTVENSAAYDNSNARGRVTVNRDGDSRTLISMRGQGLNENTRAIPAIYSEAKQAIMVLRNMTPTLNVRHFGAEAMRR
jgi:hypothetical protein